LENEGNTFALAPWAIFIGEVGGGNIPPYAIWFTNYMEVLGHLGPWAFLHRMG